MKLPATLATATAIALLLGAAALADGNLSYLSQNGDLNAALIDQSAGDGNHAGAASLAVRQNGRQNRLGFEQLGDGNEIGTGSGGFLQQSNRNTATITQSSNSNKVIEVFQSGMTSAAGGEELRRNTLSITQQGGNGNVIETVVQKRTRSALDIFGLTDGQSGNEATIVQDGTGNRVGLLSQTGRSNNAYLSFDGNRNDARSIQSGAGNDAYVDVTGSWNFIRIDQESLVLGNEATIRIVGGNANFARVSQSGSNEALITIEGNANAVSLDQSGSNEAAVSVEGHFNFVAASQAGVGNSIDVTVRGHGNNAPWLGGFSDGAHRSFAQQAGIAPGEIVQQGLFNSVEYDLGGGPLASNNNRFAFSQEGLGNRILGSTTGSNNQVVVVQSGMHNFTSFVQVGNANVIGVNQ